MLITWLKEVIDIYKDTYIEWRQNKPELMGAALAFCISVNNLTVKRASKFLSESNFHPFLLIRCHHLIQ